MSVEDITFKLSTDEAGAVNGFKRFRAEILNNEKGLERVAKQGKMTSTALKDAANVLGPEFQILGDRIDHITGAMADFKGASLATKASLIALVAVGTFEVSQMIADWIYKTKEWQKANEEAIKAITASQDFLNKKSRERFQLEMEIIKAAATEEQRLAELRDLEHQKEKERLLAEEQLTNDKRELEKALANDRFGYGKEDNAVNEKAVRLAKERVKLLNEQLAAIDKARRGPSERERELERRREALKIKPEVQEKKTEASPRAGELMAQQQRFITRGPGGRDIDRLIEIAKQQQALAQKDAMETREIRKTLWQIRDKFPNEVFE